VWRETKLTVVFVTHNVREAVRLADRVVLLSSRPGRIVATYDVTIPRPRRIDSPEVAAQAADITDRLREEVASMAVVDEDRLDREQSGLDELELFLPKQPSRPRRVWSATWPKLTALVIGLALWQIVVWTGWKPTYLFPGPATVLHHVWEDRHEVLSGTGTTLRQAVEYFAIALAAGPSSPSPSAGSGPCGPPSSL